MVHKWQLSIFQTQLFPEREDYEDKLESNQKQYCKNCGRRIPSKINFCSRQCLDDFKRNKKPL